MTYQHIATHVEAAVLEMMESPAMGVKSESTKSTVSAMSAVFDVLGASLRRWVHLGNVDARIGPSMLVGSKCGPGSRRPVVRR
jgi:hypothetical protein